MLGYVASRMTIPLPNFIRTLWLGSKTAKSAQDTSGIQEKENLVQRHPLTVFGNGRYTK